MIKQTLYPKTKRVSCNGDLVTITEKIDGSNLCIFKHNDELYIAQRNNIINVDKELEESKKLVYKGLYQWLMDHKEFLKEELHEGSVICGEWIGMGCLKYSVDEFDKRFYMFAKANVSTENDTIELTNLNYEHSLFIYPFASQTIPSFIGTVPFVKEMNVIPTKEHLDSVYIKYCETVGRNVEGFVVSYKNIISKYVRMKNGQLREHFDRGE